MSQLVYPALPGLTFPVEKTPEWKTTVHETASGREYRAGLMFYPRTRYTLKYEFLRDAPAWAEAQSLLGFFNRVKGDFDSFLFTDPDDNSVTNQQFAVGDGAATIFQLVRTQGGFSAPVYDLNGSPTIYVAGVAKTQGVDYALVANGGVQFTTAPANGAALTWTGSYYWRCRFLLSQLQVAKFLAGFWSAGKVEFRTVKP